MTRMSKGYHYFVSFASQGVFGWVNIVLPHPITGPDQLWAVNNEIQEDIGKPATVLFWRRWEEDVEVDPSPRIVAELPNPKGGETE